MSLEQAIQENTAAVREMTEAFNLWKASSLLGADLRPTAQEQAAEPEVDAAAVADEPASEAPPVSYDDCAASVTKLAKGKGRPAAVALLGEFGLKTLQDAKDKPEVLAQVKVAADAALGE